jgi:hypothetical protein
MSFLSCFKLNLKMANTSTSSVFPASIFTSVAFIHTLPRISWVTFLSSTLWRLFVSWWLPSVGWCLFFYLASKSTLSMPIDRNQCRGPSWKAYWCLCESTHNLKIKFRYSCCCWQSTLVFFHNFKLVYSS